MHGKPTTLSEAGSARDRVRPTLFWRRFPMVAILLLPGCFSSTASRIERVLTLDGQTNSGAQSIAEVVVRMRAIDTTGCPNDFRSAYLAHIHAWEEMAAVEQQAVTLQQQSNSGATIVESMIRGFLGDPFGKAGEILASQGQLQQQYGSASQSVKTSWQRVEEIAVLHGARLPKSSR